MQDGFVHDGMLDLAYYLVNLSNTPERMRHQRQGVIFFPVGKLDFNAQ